MWKPITRSKWMQELATISVEAQNMCEYPVTNESLRTSKASLLVKRGDVDRVLALAPHMTIEEIKMKTGCKRQFIVVVIFTSLRLRRK